MADNEEEKKKNYPKKRNNEVNEIYAEMDDMLANVDLAPAEKVVSELIDEFDLTYKQQMFVHHYVLTGDATAAHRAAFGTDKKNAAAAGHIYLNRPQVTLAVERVRAYMLQSTMISKEYLTAELLDIMRGLDHRKQTERLHKMKIIEMLAKMHNLYGETILQVEVPLFPDRKINTEEDGDTED